TIAQMLQYQGDQQDALHIFSLGQGPTITGPGGSGTEPPPGPPVFFQNINFITPGDHDPPPSPPLGAPPGSTTTGNDFVPAPAPPPPPNVAVPPTVSLDEIAGNETNPLPVPGISVVNTVSTDLTVLHGTLHVDNSALPPGVTVTGDDTGHLILSGDAGAVNTLLAGLAYTRTGPGDEGTDTLTVSVIGTDGSVSAASTTITVNPVAEQPTASAPATLTLNENATGV